VAQTLGQILDEIDVSLSAARKAISYKSADKEVHRSYSLILKEKNEILTKIATHGRNFIEGQTTIPRKAVSNVSFS